MASNKRYSSSAFIPDSLRINRRSKRRVLLEELESDDVESALLLDQDLGMKAGTVTNVRKGGEIKEKTAREIEWPMNRPSGWRDREPKEGEI